MDAVRRTSTPGLCESLEVHSCPLALIEFSVGLASDFVTVENFRTVLAHRRWIDLTLQLYPQDDVRSRSVSNVLLDVAVDRREFRRHLPFWDRNGVYAVFTRRGPIGFRATDLDVGARYRALRNYDWTLELAIPGPAGAEWGSISSPDGSVIDRIQEAAAGLCADDGSTG